MPVRAASFATVDIHRRRRPTHITDNVYQREVRDGHTCCGWLILPIVRLVDDNAVLGDAGECNVAVCDIRYSSHLTRLGLDSDAVLRVEDGRVCEVDIRHIICLPSAHRPDAETMTA